MDNCFNWGSFLLGSTGAHAGLWAEDAGAEIAEIAWNLRKTTMTSLYLIINSTT